MTTSQPEGITHPSIDELLDKPLFQDLPMSKYSLVIYAARRARQINSYFTPTEGMLQYVGPLVEAHPEERRLSIALREIANDKLRAVSATAQAAAAQAAAEEVSADEGFGLSDEFEDFGGQEPEAPAEQ